MISEHELDHISSDEENFIEPFDDDTSFYSDSVKQSDVSLDIMDYNKMAWLVKDLVKDVHALFLFHPEGTVALAELCTCISSLPSGQLRSWKELAGHLGLTFYQIGCIENYNSIDFTELVLKTYAQKEDATLGKVVSALEKMERFDALHVVSKHFPVLAVVARNENDSRISKVLSENNSIEEDCDKIEKQLRTPENFHHILKMLKLPITLQLISNKDKIEQFTDKSAFTQQTRHISTRKETLQRSQILSCPKVKYIPKEKKVLPARKVLLTFAHDGEEVARSVASQLRHPSTSRLPIGVLILDEHLDKVLPNPEQFIIHQFPRMDFVVPIVTIGYLEAVGGVKPEFGSALDCNYVTLIHDLMLKQYTQSGCRNKRVRCLIPSTELKQVLTHPHHKLDPILGVYLTDDDLEKLASRMLTSTNRI